MIGKIATRVRLCPHCANSVDEDATQCNYCKADLLTAVAPKWLNRKDSASEPRPAVASKKKFPIPTKFIGSVTVLAVVILAFFVGGYIQRSELSALSQANLKQLQAKDEIIQSQQSQLAQVQKQLSENSHQLAEVKIKLDESQKALSVRQQRPVVAAREVNRSIAARSTTFRRTAARAPDAGTPFPQPVATRRTFDTGVYETTQATSVYENPSSTARVITRIAGGTRINVVNSTGEWLEVRSNRGNPPGYVRADDARMSTGANSETPRRPNAARRASANTIGSVQ
jgi:outer membrane lipoprotein-sorting protein